MIKVAIIVGSTRPTRKARAVANWVYSLASQRHDAEFVIVDIVDFKLPLYDESNPPRMARYQNAHTQAWAAEIDQYDAFVFVTPEYNHSIPAALKNAIDYLFREWHHKVAGFVSYGADKGVRAVEHLRQILTEVAIADVRAKVALSLRSDFEDFSAFMARDHHAPLLTAMLDEVVVWGEALKTVRNRYRFNPMGQPLLNDPLDSKMEAKSHQGTDAASKLAMEIANRWSSALSRGDIDELLALYHPDAVLETPVTFALNAGPPGIRRGLVEVRELFTAVAPRIPLPKASLRPLPLSDGRVFVWESDHDDETTDKNEFVEVMELEDGLIRRHRFYWGWKAIGKVGVR